MDASIFERLGVFYLGRPVGEEVPLLYDSRDLTTHAVCVGMTGSGKTGLCVALLEEAAMDGVPAIIIDPKGDLGNLLLTFPELRTEDFRPWINEDDAARKGETPDAFAADQANRWRDGLAAWGQDGGRIAALREKVDMAIYTPGSRSGRRVNIAGSLDAPTGLEGADLAEAVGTAVAGLLSLLKLNVDPATSREAVFLSSVLLAEWQAGRNVTFPLLIERIQRPGFDRIGVLDVEAIYPAKDRFSLVMALNSLLASPAFADWLEGEPLDVERFLFLPDGQPRLAIFSVAHLGDTERMYFVTMLLNALVAWTRRQTGTSSLRALVYMDEVFGYLPPTANPPSKLPLLTLLKQARAFGVGVVLATQNPVDLDYKALSNAGTWFIGRLQTERDVERMLDGLQGAAAESRLPRAELARTLAGLGKRQFLLNNVHQDAPVVFETRWVMSYLRGPLTRDQIARLAGAEAGMAEIAPVIKAAEGVEAEAGAAAGGESVRPVVAPGIVQTFFPGLMAGDVIGPVLVGRARVRFSSARWGIETTRDVCLAASVPTGGQGVDWLGAEDIGSEAAMFAAAPPENSLWQPLPVEAARTGSYAAWGRDLKRVLADRECLPIWRSAELKLTSRPDEPEGDFRVRVAQLAREERDGSVDALRSKYDRRRRTLEDRLARANATVELQRSQASRAKMDTLISVGTSLLGSFLGGRRRGVGGIGTAARGVNRSIKESGDIASAEQAVARIQSELAELEREFLADCDRIAGPDPVIERVELAPARSGIEVTGVVLGWKKVG